MANNKFKAAVRKAKALYKTGKYKTFAAAVKSAYKKLGSTSTSTKADTRGNRTATTTKTITAHVKVGSRRRKKRKVGATKFIERGETKRTPAKTYIRKRSRKGLFAGAKRIAGIGISKKKQVENSLGRALVEHYKCTTISGTKKLGKRISGLKKQLRSL